MSEQNIGEDRYDASSIKVLEGLDAVRRRPAMYIGDTGPKGLHHLVWEVVDNSVDEALAGEANSIDVRVHKDGSLSVRDNGRGIPVDMHESGVPALEVIMTKLHSGGKFDKNSYKVSGGLHGVGISVVNALSEELLVEVFRDGKTHRQTYGKGEKTSELRVMGPAEGTGTMVRFKADPSIMETTEFSFEVLRKRLRELAYLMGTANLHIKLTDERTDKSEEYHFPQGLRDFVVDLNQAKQGIHDVIYIQKEMPSEQDPAKVYMVELALQYNDGYHENVFTFVNNINTIEGGTHLVGFRKALTTALNNWARQEKQLKEKDPVPTGEDFKEGLTAVLSIKVPDPQFESQTKIKLGNREAQGIVETVVGEGLRTAFEEKPATARAIFNKSMEALRAREAARKARDLVRRKSGLEGAGLPAKLADCQKGTSPQDAELFLVEGDSAGGTAKQGRTSSQAILPLRGKILNVEKAPVDSILDHEEIQTIVSAIGTGFATEEFDLGRLRYHKIIIMTDADVDGSHIRTLLLTLFYRKMPELVLRGYVYVAQPPLYAITKGKTVRYAISDDEKMDVLSQFGQGNTSIVLPDGAVLKGSQMRELVEATTRIMAMEKRMPAEGAVPFLDYLAQATAPDLLLPAYYLLHRGQGRFVDTEDQLEAALENLRSGGDLKIYEGPESGWSREDADVEVYALHLGTNLQPQLKRLQELGIYPDAFRRSAQPAWTVVTGDDRKAAHSLAEVAELVQKAFEKDVDIKRFKGLGEMEASELFETTMDPARRLLHRVSVNDLVEADRIFTILMGPTVEPRREFIERHALEATNLDI